MVNVHRGTKKTMCTHEQKNYALPVLFIITVLNPTYIKYKKSWIVCVSCTNSRCSESMHNQLILLKYFYLKFFFLVFLRNPLLQRLFNKWNTVHIDQSLTEKLISLGECTSFVVVCHLKACMSGLHIATRGNWPSEGCRDSRKIKRARLSAPSNGPLFVYTLWSRSLSFIHSLCTKRKSRGLVYVAFQGKRWPSSSWNDRGGNGGESEREVLKLKRKRERKWDGIRRHFGPFGRYHPCKCFWLMAPSQAANHPQTPQLLPQSSN